MSGTKPMKNTMRKPSPAKAPVQMKKTGMKKKY
jgi:hypothetical protein